MAAAAAAAGPRCLSDLPDELLQRILSFVPRKEAASTAVLSWRWRSLWRGWDAFYLDSRHFRKEQQQAAPMWNTEQQARDNKDFLHRVEEALAGAANPITRLFVKDKHVPDPVNNWRSEHYAPDMVAAAISSPAARHVEELHVETEGYRTIRSLSLESLSSSQVLRVLRVVGFLGSSPMAATPPGGFPRLAEIHLHNCSVFLVDLQTTIDAAPLLATLRIEYSTISYVDMQKQEENSHMLCDYEARRRTYRLICPAVTALVFENFRFQRDYKLSLEIDIDAPVLTYFRYKGPIQLCNRFLLNPLKKPSNMVQADLHLISDAHAAMGQVCGPSSFWQFIHNFSTTKVLKLKLDHFIKIDYLSMDEVSPSELPTLVFHSLERLELDAQYIPTGEASMLVLASLLHCCPVLRDLRLKLSKDITSRMPKRSSIDQVARADFDKSVDRFRHRRKRSIMHSLDEEDDDSHEEEASSYIPAVLSEQSFRCLTSCLRRVSLHFYMDNPNCLGVQLAKFFAEKALVLEELHIDDGSHKMLEHINIPCVSDKMNYC